MKTQTKDSKSSTLTIDTSDLPSNFNLFPWPLTIGEYEDMVTHYVQNFIEKNYAQRIPLKEIPFGSQQDAKDS